MTFFFKNFFARRNLPIETTLLDVRGIVSRPIEFAIEDSHLKIEVIKAANKV